MRPQVGPVPWSVRSLVGVVPSWRGVPAGAPRFHTGRVVDHADPLAPGEYAEAVLDVVEQIPPGKVMTYGDVAEYLGRGGPRQVGTVMSRYGDAVAWWRVMRADGKPLPGHEKEALRRYAKERTPMRAAGTRVDLSRARWDGEPAD